MWKRLWRYTTVNPGDPIPRLVTLLGCAMSLAFWLYLGLYAGHGSFTSFLISVSAALSLVGPALFFSNIVVRAVQDARARASVGPLGGAASTEAMGKSLTRLRDERPPTIASRGPSPLGYSVVPLVHQTIV